MSDDAGDSDLRRRAAGLLAMLAVVAVLFAVLLIVISRSGGGKSGNQSGPDDTLGPTTSTSSTHSASRSGAPTSAASSSHPAHASCPTQSVCALNYDIGDAVAAINAYRTQNSKKAVPGSVSAKAMKCALGNGGNCSGGWAESQVDKPTGSAVLAKIKQRGQLLDPGMKSFEIGWAYNPQSKQYFFAIIRDD